MRGIGNWSQADVDRTGRFLLWFLLFFLAGTLVLDVVVPNVVRERAVAGASLFVLERAGIGGQLDFSAEHALIRLDHGAVIQISELCTGILETLVILGAILATIDVEWKKRWAGAIAAAVLVGALNLARIGITVGLIVSSSDLGLVDLAHNLFFRVFLFVSVFGIYLAWFLWATEQWPKKGIRLFKPQ